MNIHVSKNDTFAREIVTKVQQVRKCIMKHCISEFVFPTGRGPANTYRTQRVGRQESTRYGRLRRMNGGTGTGRWMSDTWQEYHCKRLLCHHHGIGVERSRWSNPQVTLHLIALLTKPGLGQKLKCPLDCMK